MSQRSSDLASPIFPRSFSTMFCAQTGARSNLGTSLVPGGARDEATVVHHLKVPLAVLHGGEEQLVNGRYFGSVAMPTLWRGAVQMIPDAGHAAMGDASDLRCARRSFRYGDGLKQILSRPSSAEVSGRGSFGNGGIFAGAPNVDVVARVEDVALFVEPDRPHDSLDRLPVLERFGDRLRIV